LVVLLPAQNPTIDPAINYNISGEAILPAVYESLVKLTPDGKIAPQLATTWDVSKDGLTYTFHLRTGVKFQDGEPFNAAAVKTSIDRMTSIGQAAAYIFKDTVAEIKTPDDNTIVFVLKQPTSHFMVSLTSPWAGGVISPKAIKEHDKNGDLAQDWLKTHAVGTGPYKVTDSVVNETTTLERNPDWWGWAEAKNPNPVQKILVKTVQEAATQRLMLEQGEADIAFGIKVQEAASLKSNPQLITQLVTTGNARILSFNTARAPFDNAKLRQALSYSFPYDDAVAAYGGGAKRIIGQLPEGTFGYDASLPAYKTDLAKAKQLLADAGYANGGGLKVDYTWVTGEEDGRKAAELWQANLKQLGVTLNIREISITTFEDQIKDPKTASDIQAHYWEPDYADVTAIMNLMYHSKMKEPNGPNYSFYGNPQVDALLNKIPSELDNTKRVDLIKQAQTLVLQDAPDLWVAYVPLLVAARKDVQGYTYHPFFEWNVNYANIHK
jgi:peptide/nickel transport system substrate-binding protein